MSKKYLLLVIDGIVNLALGVLLVFFPAQIMVSLDLPKVETYLYVNILGAVLFGIGMALLLTALATSGKRGESNRRGDSPRHRIRVRSGQADPHAEARPAARPWVRRLDYGTMPRSLYTFSSLDSATM